MDRHALPAYAELHCLSHFSFQRGASHPAELVERACQLGYSALAITDECSLAGVVRAHAVLPELQALHLRTDKPVPTLKLLIGSEFTVHPAADEPEGPIFKLVVLACKREGYGNLSEFITLLRRDSPKGQYYLRIDQITAGALADCVLLLVPPRPCSTEVLNRLGGWAARLFAGRLWLAAELLSAWDDTEWLAQLRAASQATGLPLVASGDVHFHVRSRKPLQDVMTAVRVGKPVAECGLALQPNAERHLRSRMRLARHYPPDLLAATLDVAARCQFNLKELKYEYPQELVPPGETPTSHLRQLTKAGLLRRYGHKGGTPANVLYQIDKELDLIRQLKYEKFFLTVEDIVQHAQGKGILCQGRGSAANSAVCYALGVTEVDPKGGHLLFERFLSTERHEPPDIDVDFEHQRREDVIQYLYKKYGRHRTALAATVITYRTRSAVRDVGKALGFDADTVDALAKSHQWWESREALDLRLREMGIDPDTPTVQQWLALTQQLVGTPRHLSQHVGGFVIAADSLGRLVPVENAAMEGRTVIQWDKDDLEALGLLKVDVLALGMLSAIKHALAFISQRTGRTWAMQDVPPEDPDTYAMIQQADTIGVFQIESRAQMSMLPRLRPKEFYDLVVQVSIVRPGPIQGGMVHPYLQARKTGVHAPYPSKLAPALSRTMGVPIFQEQVMQIVIMGAGFTPGEADQLRRSMAAWKRKGGLEKYEARIVEGIAINLQDRAFGERIFEMIKGFGEYGFPESHAVGFAKLAYISSWLKRHEPAAFLAGLLNAQPMGFYSPRQLVRDAQRHGVEVHPVDVVHSDLGATLETIDQDSLSRALRDDRPQRVRLGLGLVSGLGAKAAQRIVEARQQQPFASVDDLARRAQLDQADLRHLAAADALQSLAGHRRQQVWEATARHRAPPLLREAPVHEQALLLPAAPEADEINIDYAATGLTLRRHPLALLRDELTQRRLLSATALQTLANGKPARACGLVTMRQQPPTAKGTLFVSIEDETGSVNVVVWHSVRDNCRSALLQSQLLAVHGTWQNVDGVCNLVAHHLEDLTPLLQGLSIHSRDFH
jgi:error-prone DNA polymerase